MIQTTKRYFCDACGKEITRDYMSCQGIIEIDEDGNFQLRGYDFCKDCTKSFSAWLKSREGTTA